jgi:predicted ATP-grasp superfamily ATP-dependent carboligase
MTIDEVFPNLPELQDPVLVLAFEGWNDAGEAATGVLDHLLEIWDSELLGEMDPEEFYDFSVHRPEATFDDDGARQIVFPTTRVFLPKPPKSSRSIVLMRGVEPNNRWRAFTEDIMSIFRELDIQLVVTLGAMLAETPHSRPIPVHTSSTNPELRARFDCEASQYEGPTGIVGILAAACDAAEIPVVSLWAAVPHYYSQPPSPKGTLALVTHLEEILDVEISIGDLPEEAHAWEADVDELAADNEEVTGYVAQLETSHDAESPEVASGDEIAREFERYLRRRDRS